LASQSWAAQELAGLVGGAPVAVTISPTINSILKSSAQTR